MRIIKTFINKYYIINNRLKHELIIKYNKSLNNG